MINKGTKVYGGDNQVNVGLSDEQMRVLTRFIAIKGLRTVQDGLRYMVQGAADFVDRELKKLGKPAMTPPAAAVDSPIDEPAVVLDDAPITSDDGMRPPPVTKSADVDEDGEEISENEKLRRARSQPAMTPPEPMRWASLKDEA